MIGLRRLGFACGLLAAGLLQLEQPVVAQASDDSSQRLVAIADIHGAYDEFVELLRAAGLVDSSNRWSGGRATLVQTGDFLDRGAAIREVMDLLRSLQSQAAAAGGEVVVLLGNHEAMNILGFRNDINREAFAAFADADSERRVQDQSKRFGRWLKQRARQKRQKAEPFGAAQAEAFRRDHPPGYFAYVDAFARDGEYGRWLRELPMVAERNNIIFLHGGISPKYVGWSVDELNARMRQEIDLLDSCRSKLLAEGVIHATSDPNEMVSEGLAEIAVLTRRIASAPPALRERMVDSLRLLQGCVGYEDWFLVKDSSPIWYRGYARLEGEELLEVVTSGLEGLGANRFVVGHTPQSTRRVEPRLDGRVFLLDTGMLAEVYRGRASALEFIGDTVTAIYLDGTQVLESPELRRELLESAGEVESGASSEPVAAPASNQPPADGSAGAPPSVAGDQAVQDEASRGDEPPPAPIVASVGSARLSLAPAVGVAAQAMLTMGATALVPQADGQGSSEVVAGHSFLSANGNPLPFHTEAEIAEFMRRADVVLEDPTDTGINRPRRAKLSADGVTVDAVFRTVDNITRKFRTKQGPLLPVLRDTYRYEPAAYLLSQHLGMDRVPPAVLRKVGGRNGSLQLWMHGVTDEKGRQESGHRPNDRRGWYRQVAEQKLFDRLIGNIDRNQGNLLVNLETEKIWLIDHTRSFVSLREPIELRKVTRAPRRFYSALKAVDEEDVRAMMEPFLLPGEVEALWSRWQKIASHLDGLLRDHGERVVFY